MNKNKFFEEYCRENIIVNFEGDLHVFTEGVAFTTSSSTFGNGDKKYIKTETDTGADIAIINEQSGVEVIQHYEIFGEVIRQYNDIKNLNDYEKVLINAASAMFAVPYKGLIPWNDDRRFRLHICKAAWSAEVQWHSGSLVDFGLNPIRFLENGIQGPGKITISSKGSWSTGAYYPIVILEDLENGETYFMEHEGGVSWKINIGFWDDNLVFDCGSADIHLDGEANVFSMINGMVGVPLISGRIDYFDELNFALAKEAVECYKAIRKDIPASCAVYPTGTELMGKRSYVTVGLINEEKTHMYLAVWKVNAYDDEVMIDLSKYIIHRTRCRR